MAFPDDFWWGTGSSATTADGSDPRSDLGAWEAAGRAPRSGSGTDLATHGAGDLGLLAEAGLLHRRHVLDWTRLEPSMGRHDVAAVESARLVLETARDQGIAIWACLHDGALPGWFAVDEHGFTDARARGYHWARHVEWVAETFADLVHGWLPVHEPNRWAADGWLLGARPPGATGDAEGFAEALEAILLATIDAARRLREGGQPVAAAHAALPAFAARIEPGAPPSADAQVQRDALDEAHHGCWVRLLDQEILAVAGRPALALPGARDAFDVIGTTYRHAVAVRGDGALLPYPQALATGEDGQVAWAEGLALTIHRLAEDLPGRRLLVAGVGLATHDEGRRRDHLRDLLRVCDEAIAGGIDVAGLWWTAPIDPDRSGAPPGLWDRDRTPRPAAELLARVACGGPIGDGP
jgi:beta-glucosidase